MRIMALDTRGVAHVDMAFVGSNVVRIMAILAQFGTFLYEEVFVVRGVGVMAQVAVAVFDWVMFEFRLGQKIVMTTETKLCPGAQKQVFMRGCVCVMAGKTISVFKRLMGRHWLGDVGIMAIRA